MRFHSLDISLKSSSHLTETLLDPEFAHAYEPNKAAFNKAYNVKEVAWSWLERPENRLNLIRFGAAMNGSKNASPANAILGGSATFCCTHCTLPSHLRTSNFAGYDWERLPEGSLVVDVGGGVGAQSLTLAQHHPQLRFVIQDRESVLGDAADVCESVVIKYGACLPYVLATVLEDEHAGCTRIWSGENPRPKLL